jgi:hypothetical protein
VVDDGAVLGCGAGRPPPALRSPSAATPGSVGVVARLDCGREPGPRPRTARLAERGPTRKRRSRRLGSPGRDPIDPRAWRWPLAEAADIHSPAVQGARLRPWRGACSPCRGRACLRSLPRPRPAVLAATARGCPSSASRTRGPARVGPYWPPSPRHAVSLPDPEISVGSKSEVLTSSGSASGPVEALERPLRGLGRRSAEKARLEAGAAAPPPQQSRCVGCGAPRRLNVVDPRPAVLPRMGESTSRQNHLKGQE